MTDPVTPTVTAQPAPSPTPTPDAGLLAPATAPAAPKSPASVLFGKPDAAVDAAPAAPPAEGVKPADAAPAAPDAAAPKDGESLLGTPEAEAAAPAIDYKFDLPADAKPDPARLDAFKAHISKLNGGKGISNEDANALLKFGLEDTLAAEKAIQAEWQKTQQTWIDQVKADPEVGGDKLLKEVVPTIRKALNEFTRTPAAAAELTQMLNSTGLGNHPVFIRTLYNMARALTEGAAVRGGGPVAPKARPQDVLFGNSPRQTN